MRNLARTTPAGLALALLCGCAAPGGRPTADAAGAPVAPAAWQAPLPHQGQVVELARWWQQFDDPALPPMLAPLIADAEAASPSVSAARSRIAQARATRVAASAALLPGVDANASAQRFSADAANAIPVGGTRLAVGVEASWELDLLGANAAGRDAAQARLEGAQAQWHAARISVAAEVAGQYNSLRACEAQLAQTQLDATSRGETARLTELAAKAGFQAPANAALARASAAQGSATLTQQRQQCDAIVKALVALTGRDEPALRDALAAGRGKLAQPAAIDVPAVPAALLRQRPDLAGAERELLAAQGDEAQARAALWPSLSLAGTIGRARVESGGLRLADSSWSLGPLTLNVPLFDGGRLDAQVAAARARRDDAALQYRATLRTAVREVEEALLALDAAARRSTDLNTAADGFAASLRATEALNRGGLASLFELEDARRSAVAAQAALIDLQRERVAAWIALYRALGGGWSDADLKQARAAEPVAASSFPSNR